MIAMIMLGALGLLAILGLGKPVLKDFRLNAAVVVIFFAMVIGLNFVPTIVWGGFSFRVGTIIFYAGILTMFFLFGKLSSRFTAFAIAVVLGGLAYAATRLALLGGGGYFADSNVVYGVVIGLIAMVVTRNGKYAFLIAAEAMMLFNLLVQIGGPVSLDYGFDWTVTASTVAVVLYGLMALMTTKPSKVSYYFEAGRLED